MDRYDIPNEEELKPGKEHDYNLVPSQYDIKQNRSTNTYDQLLMLRDFLVYSKKTYSGKAGSVLVIWDKEETVEVIIRNRFIQKLNPDRQTDSSHIQTTIQWPYVTQEGIDQSTYWPAVCRVTKSGYYKLTHKIELVNIPAGTTRLYVYIERLPMNSTWWYGQPGTGTQLAVYDDVSNSMPFDQLYTKKTIIGTVDTNLQEWDMLRLIIEDQNWDTLPIQGFRSNRWTVDYINLPLND